MRVLFDYQRDAVLQLLSHVQDIEELEQARKDMLVLQSPTGSGKTTMVLAIACYQLQRGAYDAVLVLTSNADIRDNFKLGKILCPAWDNNQSWETDGTHAVVTAEDRVIEAIRHHLVEPVACLEGGILVATHNGGVRVEDLQDVDWTRILLIIDEAHRCSAVFRETDSDDDDSEEDDPDATKLGLFAERAREQGAQVILTTATPSRNNSSERMYPPGSRLVTVPYAQVVEQAGAPETLRIELIGPEDVHALQDLKIKTLTQLEGEQGGVLSKRDALQIAKRIVSDGKPKCFLCIGRVTDTPNVRFLTEALQEVWPGVRVINGTGPENKDVFNDVLKAERRVRRYGDSKADVIIVSGRGTEGTDWPLCSHVYHVGLCQSINRVQQRLGRGMRPKRPDEIPDYPEGFRDQAVLTFFVPNMKETLKDEIRTKWHAGAMLVACFIHDHRVAREFISHIDTRIRVELSKQGIRGKKRAQLLSDIAKALPTPQERAEAVLDEIRIRNDLRSQWGREPTLAEIAGHIQIQPWDLRRKGAAYQSVLANISAQEEKELAPFKREVEKALRSLITRVRREPKENFLDTLMAEAFASVAQKWDHVTSSRATGVVEIASKILGQDTERIAKDLRFALRSEGDSRKAPPFPQIVRTVIAWHKHHRSNSRKMHGDLSRYVGYPPNRYTTEHLKQDLRERRVPGQPSDIESLDDLLRDLRC